MFHVDSDGCIRTVVISGVQSAQSFARPRARSERLDRRVRCHFLTSSNRRVTIDAISIPVGIPTTSPSVGESFDSGYVDVVPKWQNPLPSVIEFQGGQAI